MLERLQEIDTSAIEELARIKRDQEVLEDRLRLMQERKEGVSEVVFERVRGDYRKRLDALEAQARPLKDSARREFGKLQALRRELQQASDESRVAKEEIEFRHALGEFELGEYEQRAAAAQEQLDAREVELAEAEAMAERFLAAVRSQQELEQEVAGEAPPGEAADVEPGLPAPPMAIAEEVADESGGANGNAAVVANADAAAAPVTGHELDAAVAAAEMNDGATSVSQPVASVAEPLGLGMPPPPPAPMWSSAGFSRAITEAAPGTNPEDSSPTMWDEHTARPSADARAAAEADFHEAPTGEFAVPPPPSDYVAEHSGRLDDEGELSGATRILARPRLVEMDNGSVGREHALALGRTSLGRASDNLIHLLDEAVSRHHAEVVPGPEGYVLRDLGSENGIFVNGSRTPEHVLREGDVVQIGARTLVYRGA